MLAPDDADHFALYQNFAESIAHHRIVAIFWMQFDAVGAQKEPFDGRLFLVQQYGVPRFGEFDPTLLFAVTYVGMFGMMFGDIGHGLLIAAAGVLARRITAHWKTGFGAGYNPDRQQAMALIQVRDCQLEGIFRCQCEHNMGKCNRIRASGDSYKYRVSPGVHSVV